MQLYARPHSDQARATFLQATNLAAQADQAAGHFYISSATLQTVDAFLPQFEAQLEARTATKKAYLHQRRERREAITVLSRVLRGFWAALRRQVKRLAYPATLYLYYGLTLNGRNRSMTKQAEIIAWAQAAVAGEARAVADNYTPISNPDIADVQSALNTVTAASNAVAVASEAFRTAQQALTVNRQEADALINTVMKELRFNLDHLPRPKQRDIMRTYGAIFRSQATAAPPSKTAEPTEEVQIIKEDSVAMSAPRPVESAVAVNGHAVHESVN